jgi:hypothetical protein
VRLVAVATFALALCGACSKHRESVDCYMAINHAVQVAVPERDLPIPAATAEKLRVVMQARCNADRWSREMLACMTTAVDSSGLTGCFDHLPLDQQDRLMSAFAPIVSARAK